MLENAFKSVFQSKKWTFWQKWPQRASSDVIHAWYGIQNDLLDLSKAKLKHLRHYFGTKALISANFVHKLPQKCLKMPSKPSFRAKNGHFDKNGLSVRSAMWFTYDMVFKVTLWTYQNWIWNIYAVILARKRSFRPILLINWLKNAWKCLQNRLSEPKMDISTKMASACAQWCDSRMIWYSKWPFVFIKSKIETFTALFWHESDHFGQFCW